MEKHLSQLDLDRYYRKEVKAIGRSAVEKTKEDSRTTSAPKTNNSIFLCHSHLDKTIVNKVILLFKNLNTDLYIDWMDESLPFETNKSTATLIKNKIDSCNKFLFLATARALKSKWCNWELGLVYSSKGENDFAILPIESKAGKWAGSEYLLLYPEMKINSMNLESKKTHDISINFAERKEILFDEWMSL